MNTATDDKELDRALRPLSFDDFLGQESAKFTLQACVHGSLNRNEPLDHVLLSGPPGLGKTTLAGIIANEMRSKVVVVNAPSIKTKGELATVLASLGKGDILFLDEIHSLNNKVEEILYPAMEDYKLEMVAGNIPLSINLEPFTLIGATTRAGMLQRPLRDRFGVVINMNPYKVDELAVIITASAKKLGVAVNEDGALELARRSQGTPRIANRLLRRIRDFSSFFGSDVVDSNIVSKTCDHLGIDSMGLDSVMQKYLRILIDKSVPVAFSTLTALTGESKDTIEDIVEPYLLRIGLIEKTPKGRIVTKAGISHICNLN